MGVYVSVCRFRESLLSAPLFQRGFRSWNEQKGNRDEHVRHFAERRAKTTLAKAARDGTCRPTVLLLIIDQLRGQDKVGLQSARIPRQLREKEAAEAELKFTKHAANFDDKKRAAFSG